MQRKISRRALVKRALVAGAFIPAMGFAARSEAAAALPALDPKDPTAPGPGLRDRRHQGRCSRQCNLQADPEMQQLRAVPGQAGRCQRRLQYLRRQERTGGRLVQGLGGQARVSRPAAGKLGVSSDRGHGTHARFAPQCDDVAPPRARGDSARLRRLGRVELDCRSPVASAGWRARRGRSAADRRGERRQSAGRALDPDRARRLSGHRAHPGA